MLEVRIFKTYSGNVVEATKLETHVAQCDVFSPEYNPYTKDIIRQCETNYKAMMSHPGMSKNQFTRVMLEGRGKMNLSEETFYKKLYEFMRASKTPLYFSERYDSTEAMRFTEAMGTKATSKWNEAVMHIKGGKTTEAVHALYDAYLSFASYLEGRDKNIGQNLAEAEEIIQH